MYGLNLKVGDRVRVDSYFLADKLDNSYLLRNLEVGKSYEVEEVGGTAICFCSPDYADEPEDIQQFLDQFKLVRLKGEQELYDERLFILAE